MAARSERLRLEQSTPGSFRRGAGFQRPVSGLHRRLAIAESVQCEGIVVLRPDSTRGVAAGRHGRQSHRPATAVRAGGACDSSATEAAADREMVRESHDAVRVHQAMSRSPVM